MLAKNNQNNLPVVSEVQNLSTIDWAIMSFISVELKERLLNYFRIDSFTTHDPFSSNDDFKYSVIVDKANPNMIISFIALKDESDLALLDVILGKEMSRLDISKEDALALKKELMPKDTNNFYPLRKEGSIIGYIAFAFEICGRKEKDDKIAVEKEKGVKKID